MRTNRLRTLAAATANGALLAGVLGLAVPTPADAARYAYVSASEGRKAVREADGQKCLTYKELRKLIGGKGHARKAGRSHVIYTWPGSGKVLGLYAETRKGCAVVVTLDYNSGSELTWRRG